MGPYSLGTGEVGELGDVSHALGTVEGAQAQAERFAANVGVVAEPVGRPPGDRRLRSSTPRTKTTSNVIVVGSHHRSRFSKLLHGSTSNEVINEADVPVFVVPVAHADH